MSRSAGSAHDLNVDTEDVELSPLKISLSRFSIRLDCVEIEYTWDRCEVEAVRITYSQFRGICVEFDLRKRDSHSNISQITVTSLKKKKTYIRRADHRSAMTATCL